MRALVVYCHPCGESYNAAVRDRAVAGLEAAGHDVRLVDLYAEGFNPVMAADERRYYHDEGVNEDPVSDHVAHLKWAEIMVFVYPTWWFGLPAMLKGWLDRVWVPHVTFAIPTATTGMTPRMTHVKKIAIVTTCGATWLVSKFVGEPGRKTIMRGIKSLCAKDCKSLYLALYQMDSISDDKRRAYLEHVEARLAKF